MDPTEDLMMLPRSPNRLWERNTPIPFPTQFNASTSSPLEIFLWAPMCIDAVMSLGSAALD